MTSKTLLQFNLVALLLATAAVLPAHAALQRAGPVDLANGGYPAWYQDASGLALEFCKPGTQSELNGGWCLILPPNVPTGAVPEVPFTNYSGEHFYWNATAGSAANGGGTTLVLSLEGSFSANVPKAGDQIAFGRLRIKIASLPMSGDYKVYTPFGDYDFPGLVAGAKLFVTSDIGITCGTAFDCALNSQIGPFLLPSPTSGGQEVPPIPDLIKGSGVDPWYDSLPAATPYPGTGNKYIADPARVGPVTGSPLPPFTSVIDGLVYNHNRFRIEVNGSILIMDEPNFTMAGRVLTGSIPGLVTVKRASYALTATTTKMDVFATSFPSSQGRLPAGVVPALINPSLGFFDAPCATDPLTGVVTGPPTGPGLLYTLMFKSGDNWWGASQPAVIPFQTCVLDSNARDAFGNVKPAYFIADVTDEVNITIRNWDPTAAGGTLTVEASSSDTVTMPTLTVAGLGAIDPVSHQLQVVDLGGPPASVAVVSTRGGVAAVDVRTAVGVPVSPNTPVANADSVIMHEDTTAAGNVVLANDTLAGSILNPLIATVAITGAPQLGTAVLNADRTISYTPNLNANGTDIVGYTVTVPCTAPSCPFPTSTSNEGYLTITIIPDNDPPVANNDTTGAANNKPVTINVLSNDTDVDGQADLKDAVIVTLPAAGTTVTCNGGVAASVGTVCAGGLVTVTPTAVGTSTFTYNARDQALLQSLLPATVSVTVNATEAIVITKTTYTTKTFRWVVTGTDNIHSGQILTITLKDGTYKVSGVCSGNAAGAFIGTAPVDVNGNWTLDFFVNSAGVVNPSNTGGNSTGFWCTPPKQVTATSPLGGTASSNISIK